MRTFVLRARSVAEQTDDPSPGIELFERHIHAGMLSVARHASGVSMPAKLDVGGTTFSIDDALTQDGLANKHLQAALGDRLYSELALGDIGQQLALLRTDTRVLLDLSPGLAHYPWELLRRNGVRVFTNPENPWARAALQQATNAVPDDGAQPLRVLVVVGNEHGDTRVLGDEELRHMEDALHACQTRLMVKVLVRPGAADIRTAIKAHRPHVFHFIGHCATEDGIAALQVYSRVKRRTDELDADFIRDAFADVPPPRLVFVNACDTAQPLRSWDIASTFVALGSAAVVAMQAQIRGGAATLLSRVFIERLVAGATIDVALADARNALATQGGAEDRTNWPVARLTLRGEPTSLLPEAAGGVRPPWCATPDFVARWPQRADAWKALSRLRDGRRLLVIEGPAQSGKSQLARLIGEMWNTALPGVAVYADLRSERTSTLPILLERLGAALLAAGLDRAPVDALAATASQRTSDQIGRDLHAALQQSAGARHVLTIIDGLQDWQPHVVSDLVVPGIALPFSMPDQTSTTRMLLVLPSELAERIRWDDHGLAPLHVGNFPWDEWQRAAAQFIRWHRRHLQGDRAEHFYKTAHLIAEIGEQDGDADPSKEARGKPRLLGIIRDLGKVQRL